MGGLFFIIKTIWNKREGYTLSGMRGVSFDKITLYYGDSVLFPRDRREGERKWMNSITGFELGKRQRGEKREGGTFPFRSGLR